MKFTGSTGSRVLKNRTSLIVNTDFRNNVEQLTTLNVNSHWTEQRALSLPLDPSNLFIDFVLDIGIIVGLLVFYAINPTIDVALVQVDLIGVLFYNE